MAILVLFWCKGSPVRDRCKTLYFLFSHLLCLRAVLTYDRKLPAYNKRNRPWLEGVYLSGLLWPIKTKLGKTFSNIFYVVIVIEHWNTSQFTTRHQPGKCDTLGECIWEQSVDINTVLHVVFTLELLFTKELQEQS